MAVRHSREMAERLRAMLTKDKMGVHEGFMSALGGDIARTLSDYFELTAAPVIGISTDDDGNFEITLHASACRIKPFCTTQDLPKPHS